MSPEPRAGRTHKRPDALASGVFVCITAGSDLLSHTGCPCSGFVYCSSHSLLAGRLRRRWARTGNCVDDGRCRTNKRPDAYRAFCLYYCRQRPTLPHSCPCSTIGGIRLNFRVRNGNGCDPDPMTTGMLAAWGSPLRSLRELRGARPRQSCQRTRDFRLQSSIPDKRFQIAEFRFRTASIAVRQSEVCNLT